VYGYRCEDSRQNVYFNSHGQAVYMTAALGVILDQKSNTQKFFGGGQVANKAKNVSDDTLCHTDDITSISISADRTRAVSGQVGSAPAAFLWDAVTGQKVQRFKLAKGARGVDSIAISNDGSRVVCVDRSDSHNVYVFDAASGSGLGQEKGDTNKIFDVCFSAQPGSKDFVTVGAKHIKFWNADSLAASKRGVFGSAGEATSFACCAYDDQGTAYTGGANGSIYVWSGNSLSSTFKAHDGGMVGALRWVEGTLYSGGKDGTLKVWSAGNFTAPSQTIDFAGVLVRAIDVKGGNAVVGMRDGTIYEVNLASGSK
jgi:WD40 repeat protein